MKRATVKIYELYEYGELVMKGTGREIKEKYEFPEKLSLANYQRRPYRSRYLFKDTGEKKKECMDAIMQSKVRMTARKNDYATVLDRLCRHLCEMPYTTCLTHDDPERYRKDIEERLGCELEYRVAKDIEEGKKVGEYYTLHLKGKGIW